VHLCDGFGSRVEPSVRCAVDTSVGSRGDLGDEARDVSAATRSSRGKGCAVRSDQADRPRAASHLDATRALSLLDPSHGFGRHCVRRAHALGCPGFRGLALWAFGFGPDPFSTAKKRRMVERVSMEHPKPRMLLSQCLGCEHCRCNGSIIQDPAIDLSKRLADPETVCQEEIGLGIPLDPIRPVGTRTLRGWCSRLPGFISVGRRRGNAPVDRVHMVALAPVEC